MDTPVVVAKKRDRIGTRYARRLRAAGQLPAVLYGHKQEPLALSVDEREMLRYLEHGVRLFNVDIEGEVQATCLVKDLQFGYLGNDVIHMDLSRVDLTEEVEVQVPVHFIGEAVGLKEAGAIFRTVNDVVIIRCQVQSIPTNVPVDISGLEVGVHMTAGDVTIPEDAVLVTAPDLVLCRISMVAEEVEEVAEEIEGMEGVEGAEGAADGAEGESAADKGDQE